MRFGLQSAFYRKIGIVYRNKNKEETNYVSRRKFLLRKTAVFEIQMKRA